MSERTPTPLRDSLERWIASGQPHDFDWPPDPVPPPPDLYAELSVEEAAMLADAVAAGVNQVYTGPAAPDRKPSRRRRRRSTTKEHP